jgi:hypothetical protein
MALVKQILSIKKIIAIVKKHGAPLLNFFVVEKASKTKVMLFQTL